MWCQALSLYKLQGSSSEVDCPFVQFRPQFCKHPADSTSLWSKRAAVYPTILNCLSHLTEHRKSPHSTGPPCLRQRMHINTAARYKEEPRNRTFGRKHGSHTCFVSSGVCSHTPCARLSTFRYHDSKLVHGVGLQSRDSVTKGSRICGLDKRVVRLM